MKGWFSITRFLGSTTSSRQVFNQGGSESRGFRFMLDSAPDAPPFNRLAMPLAARAAELVLTACGEELTREGLLRTPHRFEKAMKDLTRGYQQNLAEVIGEGVFAAEGRGLISVREVEFYSLCEHHLLPFWGKATVAYYPGEKILGLSKVPRIVDLFARRFQVQERLTRQIAESLRDAIQPRSVMVRIEAQHLCMMMRGVEKQSSDTMTEFHLGLENLSSFEKERLFQAME
jgi:GTP cyclohydrolase I